MGGLISGFLIGLAALTWTDTSGVDLSKFKIVSAASLAVYSLILCAFWIWSSNDDSPLISIINLKDIIKSKIDAERVHLECQIHLHLRPHRHCHVHSIGLPDRDLVKIARRRHPVYQFRCPNKNGSQLFSFGRKWSGQPYPSCTSSAQWNFALGHQYRHSHGILCSGWSYDGHYPLPSGLHSHWNSGYLN